MATTLVLARASINETRVFGRVRFSRGRRLPNIELPDVVATSVRPKWGSRVRPSDPCPPRPMSREERELADLLAEILPDEN